MSKRKRYRQFKPAPLNRLFVYGIFLDKRNREHYGMSNPRYSTVMDYITTGKHIVEAVPVSPRYGAALSGLIVNVDPNYAQGIDVNGQPITNWGALDMLEAGYDRVIVETTDREKAYMYVAKGDING